MINYEFFQKLLTLIVKSFKETDYFPFSIFH